MANNWEPMANTLCWRCATVYRMRDESCPHCHATNANHDFEKAHAEMSADGACPQCNAAKGFENAN